MSSKKIIYLQNVRLSFPDLWRPGKDNKDSQTGKVTPGKYGGQFIFARQTEDILLNGVLTPPPFKLLQSTMMELAQAEFGVNWMNVVRAMDKKNKALRDGNDNLDKGGAVRDGYADLWYVKASNKAKPSIVGPRKNAQGKFDELEEAGGKPYGGCYVNAKIEVIAGKAFDQVPSQIYARLLAVQFVGDGEPFSGAPGNPEGFDDVEGAEAAPMAEADSAAADLFG